MRRLVSSASIQNFLELSLDFLILSSVVWAEFGFAAFSSGTTIKSIDNPLQKYLYPNITDDKSDLVKSWLSIVAQILAYADASLSIASALDVRDKRKKFLTDFIQGVQYLRSGDIGFMAFILNTTLFMISFLTNALSPWTGLKIAGKEGVFLKASGISMFVGQLLLMFLLYSNLVFSTAGNFRKLRSLSKKEINLILGNLGSKKGAFVLIRSIVSIVTRSLRFYGMSSFNQKYLFGDTIIRKPAPYISGTAMGYRVFSTQCINDYKKTFPEIKQADGLSRVSSSINSQQEEEAEEDEDQSSRTFSFLKILFMGMLGLVFLLRTFSTPTLFTGPIDDPQQNFDNKALVLSIAGIIFGGFGAWQYCQFMFGVGESAIKKMSENINGFLTSCKRNENQSTDDINSPLLSKDIQSLAS